MDVEGFDHLNLSVRDLGESAAWYGRVFGFARVEEGVWEGVRWAILRSGGGRGGAMLCLYEHPDFQALDGEALRARRLHGLRHFGWRLGNEEEWRATVAREGLEVEEMRWPRSTSWYVTDPTGYDIEVAVWKAGRVSFGEASAPAGTE